MITKTPTAWPTILKVSLRRSQPNWDEMKLFMGVGKLASSWIGWVTPWFDSKRLVGFALSAALSLGAFHPVMAIAAPGDIDPSFGGATGVRFGFGRASNTARSVVIQNDGNILVGGSAPRFGDDNITDFAIARLAPNGALDASFGSGGKTQVSVGAGGDVQSALAIQADGKSVIAGYSYQVAGHPGYDPTNFTVVRLNVDGSSDAAFGNGGKVVIPEFSTNSHSNHASAMAIDANGRIVIAGNSSYDGPNPNFLSLARLNPDGTLDSSFGTGGQSSGPAGSFVTQALAIDGQGRLVVAGTASDPPSGGYSRFAMLRL